MDTLIPHVKSHAVHKLASQKAAMCYEPWGYISASAKHLIYNIGANHGALYMAINNMTELGRNQIGSPAPHTSPN